jgi:hypothetical protein
MRGFWAASFLCVALVAPEVMARGKAVAVFPILETGRPKGAVVDAVFNEIIRSKRAVYGVQLVYGTRLRKRIKGDARKAAQRCGANVACLAKLGRKAGAAEVLLIRASGKGSEVQVQFVAVSVANKSIARKRSLTFGSVHEVRGIITASAHGIFGVEEVAPDLELELAPIASASPNAQTAGDDLDDLDLVAPPIESIAAASPSSSGVALVDPSSIEIEEEEDPYDTSQSVDWLTYGGWGLAGVGATLTAVGFVFGSKRSSLDSASSGETQRERAVRIEDANSAAGSANTMFILGAVTGLAGAGMLMYKGYADSSSSVDLSVGPQSLSARVRWAW